MRQIHRRFLIILFALLQCVAPLMHAHAHAEGHGGIHLPGWHDVQTHTHDPGWVDAHVPDHEVVVGLALSLKPKPDNSLALAGSSPRLPGPRDARADQGPNPISPVALPGPPPHLLPLPGSPPTV